MMWDPGVTVIKGYRSQTCKKISLVPQARACVTPKSPGGGCHPGDPSASARRQRSQPQPGDVEQSLSKHLP